jgi:nucleotide-binding universal stress UspA family protein
MLSDRLEAGLRFLHVQDKVEVALPEDNIAKQKIKTFFGKDPVVTPFADTIPHSIEQYMNAEGGDWVVTIPHQHSWLDHFLLGSETASISEHLKLPLLALH